MGNMCRVSFLWIACATVGVVAAGEGAQSGVADSGGSWKMVWQDEFESSTLDYSKWEIEVNAFGGGNNELQIYTDRKENVRVENGSLILETRRDNHGIQGTVREYSSGRVRSKHRGDWKYGRFPAPFDQRFHLVLNLAVGGGFVGPPNDQTPFPSQLQVDYIRVYQREVAVKEE